MIRKLARIVRIAEIKPIPEADKICSYRVDGWWVVDTINKYQIGDLAIYCEVDSWIPHELAPFLSKGQEPREYNGVKGERLRTVKFRGVVSQGLLLPFTLQLLLERSRMFFNFEDTELPTVGEDVTELLGIQKYEPPIPAQLSGDVEGAFPSFIPKTDQERCISKGTLIETDRGVIPIEEIVDSRLEVNVLSYDHDTNLTEFKPIIDWSSMTRKDNWVKITLKSGKEIICTKNHKIWCDDIQSYRNAKDIKIGQKVITKT